MLLKKRTNNKIKEIKKYIEIIENENNLIKSKKGSKSSSKREIQNDTGILPKKKKKNKKKTQAT